MLKHYYLDSSILVKKFIEEDGTPFVQSIFLGHSIFYTSFLTYPEVHATLKRLHRTGSLGSDKKNEFLADLEKDWGGFTVIEYSETVHKSIPLITENYPLSGADAVHLAAAVFLKSHKIDLIFLSSDLRLLHAAKDEGFQTLNPSEKT